MEIIGGIGLFLMGMSLLTQGLQSLTSDKLSQVLRSMTQSKWRGLFLGTFITALLQSSSATTLLIIGFVNSGVLSFQHSLGLIFGANLGTTVTSWIISAVGLKISMKTFALPMIGIGVFFNFSKARFLQGVGPGLTGFGLLFFGIDLMQSGMASYTDLIPLGLISAEGLLAKIILVCFGTLMSVLMQSSSAAVATTLVALYGGVVDFESACYLVIGQNIGTTFTALIGAYKASIAAKRTACAHLIFNLISSLLGFLTLPLFLYGYALSLEGGHELGAPMALSFFHSFLNILGLLVCMPLTTHLAKWIESWVKKSGDDLLETFQKELSLKEITGPQVALSLISKKMAEIFELLIKGHPQIRDKEVGPEILNHCYVYISHIDLHHLDENAQEIRLELMRALENLRGAMSAQLDQMESEKLKSLISFQDYTQAIEGHYQRMMDHLKIDLLEYEPDWTSEDSEREFQDAQGIYQKVRFELLRKAPQLSLDHFQLGRYLDVMKNTSTQYMHLMKTHHHLTKVNHLRVTLLDDLNYTESESDLDHENPSEYQY